MFFAFTLVVFFASNLLLIRAPIAGYDEMTYGKYVTILHDKGVVGLREVIQEFPAQNKYEVPPAPLRILLIAAGEASCGLTDECGVENIAIISYFSGIALILIAFLFYKKLFSAQLVIISSVLVLFSPLIHALSSRALSDTFFAVAAVGSIFYYHNCWTRKRRSDPAIFGLLLLAGFLTKETMIFFYPSFVLTGIVYYRHNPKYRAHVKYVAAAMALAPLIYLFIASYISGGLSAFLTYYTLWSERVNNIPYALQYMRGQWSGYLVDLMIISPLVFIFAIAGMVLPEPDEKNTFGKNIFLLYCLPVLAIFSVLSFRNLRWILVLEIFIRMFAAMGIVGIADKIKNVQTKELFITAILVILIIIDFIQFNKLYIVAEVYDPTTAALVTANGLVR